MYETIGEFYDWFYVNEEMTRAEVDFLDFAFRELAGRDVRDVLDVTCGTGRQSLPLAARGYRVTASDVSEAMLARLRARPEAATLAGIRCRSMADLEEVEAVDAVVSVFTAFNHLVSDEEIARTLAGFHRALRPGGLAVFDVGNFLNLLGRYQALSTRCFRKGENMAEESPWDELRSVITHRIDDVEGTFLHQEEIFARRGEAWTRHVEALPMRIFTRREVLQDLRAAGFSDVRTYRDWSDRGESKENTFRVIYVARKGFWSDPCPGSDKTR